MLKLKLAWVVGHQFVHQFGAGAFRRDDQTFRTKIPIFRMDVSTFRIQAPGFKLEVVRLQV